MDKKKLKAYQDRLLAERNALSGVVNRNEDYGREADTEATQDPADKASNSYTKELLFSQSCTVSASPSVVAAALVVATLDDAAVDDDVATAALAAGGVSDQSIGCSPAATSAALAALKHLEPKKPLLAESGLGCTALMITCLTRVELDLMRLSFSCACLPHRMKTTGRVRRVQMVRITWSVTVA